MTRGARAPRLLIVALGFSSVLLSLPGRVHAQSTGRTEALLREGVELRRRGDDNGALAVFARAYEVDHSPIALAQMGLAEQALGEWLRSEAHVREALASHGNPWIEQNRAAIRDAYELIAAHVARIDLGDISIAGATVRIDDAVVGTTPFTEPVRVVSGQVTVSVEATGYQRVVQPVDARGGTTVRPTFVFVPSNNVAAANRPAFLRPLSYGLAGASVVGLVVGIVGIAVHETNVQSYNADAQCPGTRAGAQPSMCAARLSAGGAGTAMEVVGFASGALFAAGAVTAWFLSRHDDVAHHTRAGLSCGAGPGLVGIACTLRY